MSTDYATLTAEEAATIILRKHLKLSKDKPVNFSINEDFDYKSLWRVYTKQQGQGIVLSLFDLKDPEDETMRLIYQNVLSKEKNSKKRGVITDGIVGRYAWFIAPQN